MSKFTEDFNRAIFEKYPKWREFVRTEGNEEAGGDLYISVPRATKGGEDPVGLGVSGDEIEVTISFGGWHGHFGAWWSDEEDRDEKDLRETFETIERILNDKLVAVVAKKNKGWKWAALMEPGETIELEEGEVAHVTSWSGKLDKVVSPEGEAEGISQI